MTIMQVENKYAFRGVVYSILAAVNIAAVVAIGAAACTGFLMFIGNGVVMNVFYAKVIKLDIAGYWKGIARVCFPLMLFGLMFYFVWKMNGIVIGGWGEFALWILVFGLLYLIVAYRFSMNGYEKGLVRDMLGKISKSVRIR